MKTEHTKGPWYPSFHANICIGVQNSPDGFTQMICNSILPNTDEEYEKERIEIEANMKLIAAAPELLEALVNLASYCNNIEQFRFCEEFKISISVIKKARGL
jgi:hypothetical protein